MKKIISILLILMCIFSLASCGEKPAEKDHFRIVTSFYPVYVTTLNLVDGADGVELVNMTDTDTGCLHDYVMSTEDIKRVGPADLFIANGLNMEAFVGKVSLGIPGLELLDSGEDVPYKIGEYEEENPHYWMNIDNVIAQTEKIRKNLCRLNPQNTDVYNRNAEEYTKKLNALKTEAATRCSNLNERSMAVFHDSLDYFAEEFGMEIIPLLPETSDSDKSATKIITKMKLDEINTLFTDEGNSLSPILKAVQKATKCDVVVLDVLNKGEINENTKDAYIDAIRKNLDLLEEKLGKK